MQPTLSRAEVVAFLNAPVGVNASRSAAAVCATWACHGPGCNRDWTRPSRSHDGASCHVCRRSKGESDAFRDRLPLYATPRVAVHVRRFRLPSSSHPA